MIICLNFFSGPQEQLLSLCTKFGVDKLTMLNLQICPIEGKNLGTVPSHCAKFQNWGTEEKEEEEDEL